MTKGLGDPTPTKNQGSVPVLDGSGCDEMSTRPSNLPCVLSEGTWAVFAQQPALAWRCFR